jgi:hypothetical protein
MTSSVKYKSMKAQHQQVEVDRSQTLTEFIKEYEIKLKPGERYDLSDIAVTSDNKLLLCNRASSHKKVYIYFILLSFVLLVVLINCMEFSYGKVTTALSVHGTTVIHQGRLVNDNNKINIERCYSVTAVKDKICIGGEDKVIILNTDGSLVREISTNHGINYNLLYNERNDHLQFCKVIVKCYTTWFVNTIMVT